MRHIGIYLHGRQVIQMQQIDTRERVHMKGLQSNIDGCGEKRE